MSEICLPSFAPVDGVEYSADYVSFLRDLDGMDLPNQLGAIRSFVLRDVFFLMYFVMQWGGGPGKVNRRFVVERCREVESGPESETLDLWARFHFKSTIWTAVCVQSILRNPDECGLIAAKTKGLAVKHARPIRETLELPLLKACFPDVLFSNPERDSPKWTEMDGFTVRRSSTRKECTVETCGVIESLPTGSHYDWIRVEDLEDQETVDNPDQTRKVNDRFEKLYGLRTEGARVWVQGTPYSHMGTYTPFLADKRWPEGHSRHGEPMFNLRQYPATEDGTLTGAPVLFSDEEWAINRGMMNSYNINCQFLMNPTPVGARLLNADGLNVVPRKDVPRDLVEFMIIDPAGDSKGSNSGDSWAILRCGVEPKTDDLGASRVFILDMALKPMSSTEATDTAVRMYLSGAVIQKLGVEKTGLSTAEVHIANALREKGRYISEENGTLVILTPRGRKKTKRIEDALCMPLDNGKIFISDRVPNVYIEGLMNEVEKFPYYHPDGLDALAYLYELMADYDFTESQSIEIEYDEAGVV